MMKTVQERFEAAKKEIRKNGVRVKVNVQECCRGCVSNEKLNVPNDETPIIWHFGGQGHAFGWDCGEPVDRAVLSRGYARRWKGEEETVSGIWFNHNALSLDMKEMVVNTFTKHGIVVDWNYSEAQCILIDFDATLANDQMAQAANSMNDPMAVAI